ncbi:MAG: SRPBCC family protein [Rhodomicrobium sp.]
MLRTIAIAAAVLIAGVLVYAATKPDTFRVERTTSIEAAPGKIFPLIDDFHAWSAWSPYDKRDPAMKRTFSGAEAGEGAVYEWDGNDEVGKGRMEITKASPPSKVVIQLDFLKPFEGRNTAEFTLDPSADGSNVTWAMSGRAAFTVKLLQVFMDFDKTVGKDFEAGLAKLKAAAER